MSAQSLNGPSVISDRGLIVEAALWLSVAALALRVLPFRRLARCLGAYMQESSVVGDEAQLARATLVG